MFFHAISSSAGSCSACNCRVTDSEPLIVSCRFPFIACEIFTCEIDVIFKTLVEDEEV